METFPGIILHFLHLWFFEHEMWFDCLCFLSISPWCSDISKPAYAIALMAKLLRRKQQESGYGPTTRTNNVLVPLKISSLYVIGKSGIDYSVNFESMKLKLQVFGYRSFIFVKLTEFF